MPPSYTWPITSPPAPSPPPSGGREEGSAALLSGASGRPRRGLLAPLRRSASDFAAGEGAELIHSEIRQILGTRCSSATTQGELPWRTEFGSLLYMARHRNNDAVLEALLTQWTVDAIGRWLPFIRITRTRFVRRRDESGQENVLEFVIFWEMTSRGGQILGSGATNVTLPPSSSSG